MPTDSDFALITDRKLLGVRDFDLWLLQYLRDYIGQSTKRLFIQGSFAEQMPLSSSGANQIQVDLKPTLLDGFAHDGSGHLLDLEVIDRTATFANVNGQAYEVGAAFVEYPIGIRSNPYSGKYEYDHMREGIGVAATPDSVTVATSTLTFVVDALFEQGVSPADHSGRQVRVFLVQPGDAASSDAIAIETCTVFYDGQNKITTTGLLGQSAPQSDTSYYIVQLIGISVLMNTATNRPTALPESYFFVGTVAGNGGVPSSFDISGQQVIKAQTAASITVDPLGDWFDGTTNPGGTAQQVLEKIVSDLTSTTGEFGAGKISAPVLPAWADGSVIPQGHIRSQLQRIVQDLAETGAAYGAERITSDALVDWADGTTNPAGSVQDAISGIVAALVSNTGQYGAGKLSAPALATWADGTTNPAATLAVALLKITTDLTATTGARGAGKLTAPALAGTPVSIAAQPVSGALLQLLSAINNETSRSQRRAEMVAVQSLRPVYVNPTWTIQDLAYARNGSGSIGQLVAVGDDDTLLTRPQNGQWTKVVAAGGVLNFKAIARTATLWCIVGDGGNIQTSTDGITWTSRKSSGSNLVDVFFASDVTLLVAVGNSGALFTSTDGLTWTSRTGAAGMTTDDYVGVAYANGNFAVVTATGKIMTSVDGISWTQQASGTLTGTSPHYLVRQLHADANGFMALYARNSGEIGTVVSFNGTAWSVSTSASGLDADNVCLGLLDEQVAFFSTKQVSPLSLNAIVTARAAAAPSVTGSCRNIFDITDCRPRRAINVDGVLFVVGLLGNGDGLILSGAPFRPTQANDVF